MPRSVTPPPTAINEQPPSNTAYVDGRTLRATHRTTPFATRVTEELYHEIKVFSAQNRLKLNEFVEQAFQALKEKMGQQ